MRVLFLDQFSDLGGAQLCLRDVLIEVRRRGWDAEVMAPGNGPLLDFARDCGFDARMLPIAEYSTGARAVADIARFGVGMARSARLVRLALQQRPADLIHVNGPRLLPAVLRGSVPRDTPVVFHAHSGLSTRYARALAGWSLRRTRATAIACSKFAARPVQNAIGGHPVRVVYNGVADCGFRPRAPQRGRALRVGLVGRIAPEKGHLDFIRAAQLLQGAGLQFSIAGAALFSELRYERAVRELGVFAGIEFRGWTDDVAGVLHDLDILVVPSAAHEASTRVVMEAMSAGACVVAVSLGGLARADRQRAHRPTHRKAQSHRTRPRHTDFGGQTRPARALSRKMDVKSGAPASPSSGFSVKCAISLSPPQAGQRSPPAQRVPQQRRNRTRVMPRPLDQKAGPHQTAFHPQPQVRQRHVRVRDVWIQPARKQAALCYIHAVSQAVHQAQMQE